MSGETTELGTFRTIQIPFARPGMPLARAAVTENGRIIFTSGTVLSEGRIKILRNTYIRHVHVWDNGQWDLPAEAYKGDGNGDGDDASASRTVDGLLGSIQGLNNELLRGKKIDGDFLKKMGTEVFGRIQKEPLFKIFLQVDRSANYLFSHMVNVGVLGVAVCRGMGMPAKDIWNIFVGGVLMDVGMLHVREDLWLSDKIFSESQRREVEKHTEFGHNAIRRAKGAEAEWALPALEHHERLDGSGYPDHKDARTMSRAARILAVCDVYESLLRDRLWRKAFPPDAAIRELLGRANKFDREVVGHLAKTIGIYPVGSRVKLSDGRDAEVVQTNPDDLLRPVVLAGTVRIDLTSAPAAISISSIISAA